MAYDHDLADRIRASLADVGSGVGSGAGSDAPPDVGADVGEKHMFGGLAFLVGGHLAVAASGQGGLMVRCDPGDHDGVARLLDRPGVSPMVMRGRELDGWLRVDAAHVTTVEQVRVWVELATAYTATLPPG